MENEKKLPPVTLSTPSQTLSDDEVWPDPWGGGFWPPRIIMDTRVPLGDMWFMQHGKIVGIMRNGRRECDFANNECELGLGHPGDHLVPMDYEARGPRRLWGVFSQDGRLLRTI